MRRGFHDGFQGRQPFLEIATDRLVHIEKHSNSSFGGDPAPNAVKQLKIQYKINGKAGEATFAENALIVLPMPK